MKVTNAELKNLSKTLLIIKSKKLAIEAQITGLERRLAERPIVQKALELIEIQAELAQHNTNPIACEGLHSFMNDLALVGINKAAIIRDILEDTLRDLDEDAVVLEEKKKDLSAVSSAIAGLKAVIASTETIPTVTEL